MGKPLAWSDRATPLATSEPTCWVLGEPDTAAQGAQMFGVMAVASAPFQGRRDGTTLHGSMEFGNRLSGPHTFEVRADLAALLADPTFRRDVSRFAYCYAQNRTDAGRLADAVEHGQLWPLPNVVINELEAVHG